MRVAIFLLGIFVFFSASVRAQGPAGVGAGGGPQPGSGSGPGPGSERAGRRPVMVVPWPGWERTARDYGRRGPG